MQKPAAAWLPRWKCRPKRRRPTVFWKSAKTWAIWKPEPGTAPSNLAVIGRYILSPNVLSNLNRMKSGAGGEIQLTDAIADEIAQDNPVYGYRFRGQRFDCGSKSGFLQATVSFGLAREELRDDLAAYIRDIVNMEKAAE